MRFRQGPKKQTMKKQTPPPYYFTDHDGRHLVQLHVHGSDTPTVTEAVVWDNAKRRYGLTGSVYMSSDGQGHRYVVATIPGSGSHAPLARLLLGRPSGYRVCYVDGNSLNLMPENFQLVAPWADERTAAEALALHLASARQDSGSSQSRSA